MTEDERTIKLVYFGPSLRAKQRNEAVPPLQHPPPPPARESADLLQAASSRSTPERLTGRRRSSSSSDLAESVRLLAAAPPVPPEEQEHQNRKNAHRNSLAARERELWERVWPDLRDHTKLSANQPEPPGTPLTTGTLPASRPQVLQLHVSSRPTHPAAPGEGPAIFVPVLKALLSCSSSQRLTTRVLLWIETLACIEDRSVFTERPRGCGNGPFARFASETDYSTRRSSGWIRDWMIAESEKHRVCLLVSSPQTEHLQSLPLPGSCLCATAACSPHVCSGLMCKRWTLQDAHTHTASAVNHGLRDGDETGSTTTGTGAWKRI
ncbi:unnamed protein product [Pleuronectes platessa]|uniref:Uncharacterized protein n=1 Tax=Pleuronectes platessa TaxID=8262 RepID=A0A9N7TMD7_PLEPL|nr:unnamed protein product [Pleuronectes platessa]